MKYWLCIFLVLLLKPIFAQKPDITNWKVLEIQMQQLGQQILKSDSEEERNKANQSFTSLLEQILQNSESFNYPFDSLTTIARLKSPDNSFRIFNWHLPKDDGTYNYYGYIQHNPSLKKRKKETPPFYKLTDTKDIKAVESKVLSYQEWPGVHYYSIIPVKKKKNFILLGWDGNNRYSTKKVIDVLHFTSIGEPKFGAPIFKMEGKTQKRVIFEYKKDATMSLRYQEQDRQKKIIFNHLAPPSPQLKGQYRFYISDLEFDAFHYENGIWKFEENIAAKNTKSIKDKNWNKPEKPISPIKK